MDTLTDIYKIERKHIEHLILTCYLNQHRTLELDKLEYEASKIPFELFKASMTTKAIAKAIYNLQVENMPVDDECVLSYLSSRIKIDLKEFEDIITKLWISFPSMNLYLNRLKVLDKEEQKLKVLEMMR